jgi:low temperature requirement protein LtrA
MSSFGARSSLLRGRTGHAHHRVTFIELFFDLVFVFAVTQLSHGLLGHLDAAGAAQTTFLMLAVWWVWITTPWMTNWLDPERQAVRIVLFAMMGVGLVLSSAIPQAFGERAAAFAWAYVALQVGRTLFMLWSLRRHQAANYRNFLRIMAWLAPAAVLWIAGAHGPSPWRFPLWAAALFLEGGSPWWGFWTPGLGRSTTADWDVEGGHMAERCGLFIIIALGESILVTGSTFAGLAWTVEVVAAFFAAFLGSVAMWWIYFAIGAERGSRQIASSQDPGRLARMAYTYLHVPIVAGVVVAAVADELVLAHPSGHAEAAALAAIIGGPALYLVGNALFKRGSSRNLPLSHLGGLGLLAILAVASPHGSPLTLSLATTAILIVVAAWEWGSLGRSAAQSSGASAR